MQHTPGAGEAGQKKQYIAVEIQKFRNSARDISFEVYLKLSDDNYAHVFSKASGLDYRRLAQYIQKGVKHLYVSLDEREAYERFLLQPVDQLLLDPNTPNEKKIATLLNMTEQNMAELFVQLNVPEVTAEKSRKVVNSYVDLMTQSPKTLSILLKLASHGEYLYYHAIAVSIFSLFIARATGQFDRRMLEVIGLGGFLHDIGCTQLSKEVTESSAELSPAQWKEMRSHPKLGLMMIEHTPSIPDEVKYIVYQHHETETGTGYPNGLKGPAIFYPAKIVALADGFTALITRRPFRPAYSVDQAIQILQTESRKYDPSLVQILASVLLRNTGGAGFSGNGMGVPGGGQSGSSGESEAA